MKSPSQQPLSQADILRKLQRSRISSPAEYEHIIENLQKQGDKLLQSREELKIRVELLKEKQKQMMEDSKSKKAAGPRVDYKVLKMQLEAKYREYEAWRRKSYSRANKGGLNLQLKDYLNKLAIVEAQIAEQAAVLADQNRSCRKMEKSVRAQLKKLNKNVPHREALEEENKELKRQIWNLRIVSDLTSHVDVRVHSSLVSLQNKQKFIQKLKTMTIEEIRRQQAKSKIEIIRQEAKVRTQRDNIIRRMKTESRSRISSHKNSIAISNVPSLSAKSNDDHLMQKEKKIEEQQAELKNTENELSQLQHDKNMLLREQQKVSEKLTQQQEKILARTLSKKQPEFCDVSIQVQQFDDVSPLPLELIGSETLLLQDDRLVLRGAKDTFISGLVAYENSLGIACLRALYSNSKQTSCIVPEPYLAQKCKSKKIIVGDAKDYLKWFKAYYDKEEKKLVRLEVFSQNKLKFQIGKDKELMFKNVVAFKFDISVEEIPVCLRVCYRLEEGDWLVTSMGLEINSK